MKRTQAFNTQTVQLFGPMSRGIAIPQLIQQYGSATAQIQSSIMTGAPALTRPELYLYGDLKRANDLFKLYGYSVRFYNDCVRNPNRHQWCMPTVAANQAATCIGSLNFPGSYRSFDDLYNDIAKQIGTIAGIGQCAIYDAALRIGHTMKLEPDDYVYIHDGLRKCAEKIIGQPISKNTYKIPRSAFDNAYPGFKSMPSKEIEDFICIYKAVI